MRMRALKVLNGLPRRGPVAVAVVLCVAVTACAEARASDAKAVRAVEAALAKHGGLARIEDAGGLDLRTEGTFDLTARLQGRSPFRREPTPISERVAVDMKGGRLAYDRDWFNYAFSRQKYREIYDGRGRILYVDERNRAAFWLPFAAGPDAKARYKRFLPNFLLADALSRRDTLLELKSTRHEGHPVRALAYNTEADERITLYIDRAEMILRGASARIDMELLGDAEIRWSWSDYRHGDGLLLPRRLRVHLDGRLLKDARVDIRLGMPADAFEAPEGIEVADPPRTLKARSDLVPYGNRPGRVRELSSGVYLVPNLRPGFHMLFVEFEDFVLAVDAPAGWYEIQQIPPSRFFPSESISALGAKFIRTIKETVPDKPIRYVVLTHHHSDHIGGIRPFIAEGATILAAEPAAALAGLAAERPHTLRPDALTGSDARPEIELVKGGRVISDGRRQVRLIELPKGNPKANGFLVVYLPAEKIMYLTSFLYPVPEAAFPVVESIPLSLWFVRWLDRSGLEVDRLYNVHGQGRVQDWQLARFRQMLESGDHEIAGE